MLLIYLLDGFKCEFEEIEDFLGVFQSNIYTFTTDYIKKLFRYTFKNHLYRDINTNLLRKFNLEFKKDKDGKNRDWRTIEEEKIREMHT